MRDQRGAAGMSIHDGIRRTRTRPPRTLDSYRIASCPTRARQRNERARVELRAPPRFFVGRQRRAPTCFFFCRPRTSQATRRSSSLTNEKNASSANLAATSQAHKTTQQRTMQINENTTRNTRSAIYARTQAKKRMKKKNKPMFKRFCREKHT